MNQNLEDKIKKTTVVIMAAGHGTRMKSILPKVLHKVSGTPMLERVIRVFKSLGVEDIRVVLNPDHKVIAELCEHLKVKVVFQENPQGTGHAVQLALGSDTDSGIGSEGVFISNGDHPLLSQEEIQGLLSKALLSDSDLTIVSACLPEPGRFGRVVKQGSKLLKIVEASDASAEELQIDEIYTGLMWASQSFLSEHLSNLKQQGPKKEYYLTELVEKAIESQASTEVVEGSELCAFGVNNQAQLSEANTIANTLRIQELWGAGVTVLQPETVWIEDGVVVEPNVHITGPCYLKSETLIKSGSRIEPNCWIENSILEKGVHLKFSSHLEKAQIGESSVVGPFARLRPGTVLEEDVKIGNFVEVKKATFKKGAKASHLTYIGDAEVGEDTNIGCGVITCNYAVDKKKYKTVIGRDCFVGSDVQLVAPVTVGDGAVIGSGTTVTKDVPSKALAVGRAKQVIKENYNKG